MRGRFVRRGYGAAVVALALLASGCVRGCTSRRPPIHLNPNMDDTPRYEAQEASAFFYDGKAMREPVPGTIPRGHLVEDPAFVTGRDAEGAYVQVNPLGSTSEVLSRGAERYGIYCAPCHDPRGTGKGILAERANVPTADLTLEKIREQPDGQIFETISDGLGLMPGYRWPIPPRDRWAIIAHVRELQQRAAAARLGEVRP